MNRILKKKASDEQIIEMLNCDVHRHKINELTLNELVNVSYINSDGVPSKILPSIQINKDNEVSSVIYHDGGLVTSIRYAYDIHDVIINKNSCASIIYMGRVLYLKSISYHKESSNMVGYVMNVTLNASLSVMVHPCYQD